MSNLLRGVLCCLVLVCPVVARAQGSPRVPTLFLVGDLSVSSVQNQFATDKIHLQESLSGNMTTREYVHSGAWDTLLAKIQSGDFVVMDFGPDDVSGRDRRDATRTLAGFGDGTFDYLNPGTNKIELVHSYGWYLRRMVVDVINRGGSPLLCAGPADPEKPGAGDWARYIANEQRIPLVPVRPDGHGLVEGLRSLPVDPVAPFLKTAAEPAEQSTLH